MEIISYVLTNENIAEFNTFLFVNRRKNKMLLLVLKVILIIGMFLLQIFVLKKWYSFFFTLLLIYVILTKFDLVMISFIYRKILKTIRGKNIIYNNIQIRYNAKTITIVEKNDEITLNKNDIISLLCLDKICVIKYNRGSIIIPLDKIFDMKLLSQLCYNK